MTRTPSRHRIARIVLVALIALHVGALWLYVVRTAQTQHLDLYLSAREQWREGHLDAAADGFRRFATGYGAATRPFLLRSNFPSEASAWFALGRIETERGNVDAALAALRRSLALAGGRGRREYRDLLLRSGRAEELTAFATAELARDPDSAIAWWDLGAVRLGGGDARGAALAYQQALARLPAFLARLGVAPGRGLTGEEADLENLLSVAWLEAGDSTRAAETCNDVAVRAPPAASLDRLCRAYLYAALGNRDGAAEQLRRYQPVGPEHEALVERLRSRLGIPAPEPGTPYADSD